MCQSAFKVDPPSASNFAPPFALSRPGAAKSSCNAAAAGLRGCDLTLAAVFEAPAFVTGLNDFAMMCEPVEERGCHLCITEDAWPFTEGEVGGDNDRGAFIELADQMEQELTAGLCEGQIAQLVEDQEVETGDQIGGPALAFGTGLGIELVDQVDNIEE